MTTPRRLPAASYNSLKTGWKLLLDAVGGVDAMAASTRVGKTRCSDYGNLQLAERFAPVDVVLDAELIAGEPLLTRALAHAQGYELVPIGTTKHAALAVLLARIGRDSSDLFAQSVAALAGGDVAAAERGKMLADLEEMRNTAAEMFSLLSADKGEND